MPEVARGRSKPKLSEDALALVARRFRVLSEPTRLLILQELFDGELSVSQLVERTGTQQANVSRHLGQLAKEGLVSRRKEGSFAYYRIADPSVFNLCETVCGSLAERLDRLREQLG